MTDEEKKEIQGTGDTSYDLERMVVEAQKQKATQPDILMSADELKKIEERERAAAAEEAQVEKVEPEPEKKEEPKEPSAEVLAQIEEKLKQGQELTDDEKTVMSTVDKALEKPPEEEDTRVWKIGDTVMNTKEAEVKMREATKLGGVDLAPEVRDNILEMWVKQENIGEAHKSIDKGYQEAAATKKAAEAQERAAQAQMRMNDVLREQAALEREKDLRNREKERLVKLAASSVTKEQTRVLSEDGVLVDIDADKQYEYSRKLEAQQRLQEIAEEDKQWENREFQNRSDLMFRTIEEFQSRHPEYGAKEDVRTLAQKLYNKEFLEKPERNKVLELVKFFRTSLTDGLTMEDVWEIHKDSNTLIVRVAAQSAESGKKIPELPKPESMLKKIEEFRKRQSAAPSSLPPGSGPKDRGKVEKKRLAEALVAEERRSLGGRGDDQFLRKDLGY